MKTSEPFHVGYLVNQYPKTSHSFIRREIQALEGIGAAITLHAIQKGWLPPQRQGERTCQT